MWRFILIITTLIITSIQALSKNLDSVPFVQHKEFYLEWDNDMWVQTDYYYTQEQNST